MCLTGGWVYACRNVKVAESIGMGTIGAALLVAVVAMALVMRQAASQRGLGNVPIQGEVPRFLKIKL